MRSLVLLLVLFPVISLKAQVHRYSVEIGGKTVGELVATIDHKGEDQIIHVQSDAHVKLLWKNYGRKTIFMNHFNGNKLIQSHAISYFNDQLEDSVVVISNHQDYSSYRYPDEKRTIPQKEIHLTTSNLFFIEPENIDSVYSERFLEFCKLNKNGEGKYELLLPDGSINNYTYTNHQLKEILIDRPWVNLRIRKQQFGE